MEARAGVELVPLLDRRRYPGHGVPDDPLSPTPRPRARQGRPGAHLPTTDVTNVTKVKEDVSQEKEQTWRDLAAQIDRKRRQMEASRAEEMERSRQHFETWQMLWGRPGHGAPRDVKVKENLDVILYHLDREPTAAAAASASLSAAAPTRAAGASAAASPRVSPRPSAAAIEALAQPLPAAAPALAAR
ncbi:Protein unc-79-like protein [Frankliniella fusca]|uniref:Protein unc-79-like protein n=1 Tax=Frankliniella fusca TaxID=407009 RepID=A0AAE1HW65_9NEOP|nr:Protein unc-79-like protein [Frankliniella fusca]